MLVSMGPWLILLCCGVFDFEDIDGGCKWKESIHEIFENWSETIIWSCLQGIMGEIHTNLSEEASYSTYAKPYS